MQEAVVEGFTAAPIEVLIELDQAPRVVEISLPFDPFDLEDDPELAAEFGLVLIE